MAVQLDSDERARVDAGRLQRRPTYYSAALLKDQTISEDFEAFLILQDPATIAVTMTWLGAAGLLGRQALDRDALAFEALIVDQSDVGNQLDDADEKTAAFTAFRQAFQAGKFSDTPEVSLIIRDLQITADELFALKSRLFHLQHVQTRVQNLLSQSVSPTILRELQSWPTPLLTY
jgi:hypothetical protein